MWTGDKVYAKVGDRVLKGVIKDYRSVSKWYKATWHWEYQILTETQELFWVHEDNVCER